MNTLTIMVTFLFDLLRMWAPFFGILGFVGVGFFVAKTYRTARRNAEARAARAAAANWLAPVIQFPVRHPDHVA
jgi:hypothetical protein